VNVKLAYGKTGLEIKLPDDANVTVIEPKYVHQLTDQVEALRMSLREPVASPPLKELIKQTDTIGIIFSDITRATPNHIILPVLLDELKVPDDQIILFNATGTHRANTEAELTEMLGAEIVKRYRIVQNDANAADSHSLVGTTKSGNDIWIHSEYLKCDKQILTGFVEPHFFAGFSGGPKAVMPGLARADTILRNHSVENIDSPLTRWAITYGNPLWEEVLEAASMTKPDFLLNVALNRQKQITAVFAGDLEEAHRQACGFVKENAMAGVKAAFDIVISSNSGYPLDLNLYQAVKAMSAAAQIVKPDGHIIIAADCWDGIPEHGEYGKLLSQAESPQQLLETIRQPGYSNQDMWQAQIHALISEKTDVYFYSDNLSDKQIKDSLLKPCHNIEDTVSQLLDKYSRSASICVLPQGPHTIPYIRSSE